MVPDLQRIQLSQNSQAGAVAESGLIMYPAPTHSNSKAGAVAQSRLIMYPARTHSSAIGHGDDVVVLMYNPPMAK